jgi:hypothetical protein
MTTIVWHDDFLYCDSQVKILGDTLQTLTKARSLAKPAAIFSESEKVDDHIYGFIVTGLMMAGHGFIETLIRHQGDLNKVLKLYDWAQNAHLIGDTFTLLLFGGQSNYLLSVSQSKVEWQTSVHGTSLGLGSGGSTTMDEIKKGSNPIRAMYKTFLIDPDNNGGIIDVWQHLPAKGIFFQRFGIRNKVADMELPGLITDMKTPLYLDLYSKPALDQLLPDMDALSFEKLSADWARRRMEEQAALMPEQALALTKPKRG